MFSFAGDDKLISFKQSLDNCSNLYFLYSFGIFSFSLSGKTRFFLVENEIFTPQSLQIEKLSCVTLRSERIDLHSGQFDANDAMISPFKKEYSIPL